VFNPIFVILKNAPASIDALTGETPKAIDGITVPAVVTLKVPIIKALPFVPEFANKIGVADADVILVIAEAVGVVPEDLIAKDLAFTSVIVAVPKKPNEILLLVAEIDKSNSNLKSYKEFSIALNAPFPALPVLKIFCRAVVAVKEYGDTRLINDVLSAFKFNASNTPLLLTAFVLPSVGTASIVKIGTTLKGIGTKVLTGVTPPN
jgi:hypothetical protein